MSDDSEKSRVPPDNRRKHNESIENLSEEDLNNLLPEFERLEEDFRDLVDTFDSQTAKWRVEKGKARLSLLLNSQEETMRCLHDADPDIRELALHLALEHWKIADRIAKHCEEMCLTDPSPNVRVFAVSALGTCFRGQKSHRIAAICAAKVSDLTLSLEERQSAYLSLVRVMDDDEDLSIAPILMDFPAAIDWNLVNRALTSL